MAGRRALLLMVQTDGGVVAEEESRDIISASDLDELLSCDEAQNKSRSRLAF